MSLKRIKINVWTTSGSVFARYTSLSLLPEQPATPRAPQIIVNFNHLIVSAGSNVTLVCNALNFRYYEGAWWWTFNGNSNVLDGRVPSPYYSQTVMKFDDHITMVLDVINVSERHSGLYECSVFHWNWPLEKNNITLIVDEKGNLRRVFLDSFKLKILILYFTTSDHCDMNQRDYVMDMVYGVTYETLDFLKSPSS